MTQLAPATSAVSAAAAVPDSDHAGLRERKKAATRHALGTAAMRLAIERGLDNVLVEDIADAAGVSARTFNNYFASKYEAICALQQDRANRIGQALAARPADEPIWPAMTAAILAQFPQPGSMPLSIGGQSLKDWLAGVRLVITSPPLAGEYLKVQGQAQYHLAEVIAQRLGTSTQTDMFPRILAGAVHGGRSGGDGAMAVCRPARAA